MAELDKVIKGLECHADRTNLSCNIVKCPYFEMNFCGVRLAQDALELLKEQDDMGKELGDAVELIHKKNERIEKLLKEQEAEWIEYPKCLAYDGAYSDSHIVCSACKHVFSIMDNCTEEFDYCPHCGAKMKQEGR